MPALRGSTGSGSGSGYYPMMRPQPRRLVKSKYWRSGTSGSSELPPLTETESDTLIESDDETDDDPDFRPEGLDQAWNYTFKRKERVWVMRNSRWWFGFVVLIKDSSSWTQDGIHYQVQYGGRFRAWFSPLEGAMKPNTPYIRRLLKEEGWL
ncbi:hypothetical protein OBBRIDRAFT_789556 [Obba rivulosa]|uniref:Uncharacterized protein n=1 Tax=Obba rivulosa TaxID=1052685 RepID=A0A8E2DR43_9APHY|nr:hypothetical protein OBBRIDRAFT_789556 [Obba rivulosa]